MSAETVAAAVAVEAAADAAQTNQSSYAIVLQRGKLAVVPLEKACGPSMTILEIIHPVP